MKLGIVTYNIARDWDLETLIANCEETGFAGVELRTTHAQALTWQHPEQQQLMQRARRALPLKMLPALPAVTPKTRRTRARPSSTLG